MFVFVAVIFNTHFFGDASVFYKNSIQSGTINTFGIMFRFLVNHYQIWSSRIIIEVF